MNEYIHGYRILRREGSSLWIGWSEKQQKAFALKEYISCRFPVEEGQPCPEILKHLDTEAQAFLEHMSRLSSRLGSVCRQEGLLNIPVEVFREGKRIYKATVYIESCGIPTKQLHCELNPEQMNVIFKTALCQLDTLAGVGFVHGDIKPSNLVIREKNGIYSAAIIDYDGGFFQGEGCFDSVAMTPEYAAPELLVFRSYHDEGEQKEAQEALQKVTDRADVFSMACTFFEMAAGGTLSFEDAQGEDYPAGQTILKGCPLFVPPDVHPVWRTLLRSMLCAQPANRPSAREATNLLNAALVSGAFSELSRPFDALSGLETVQEQPKMCTAEECVVEECGRPRLLRHIEEAFQISGSLKRAPGRLKPLQEAQAHRLAVLKKRVGAFSGIAAGQAVLALYEVMQDGHRVFVKTALPAGEWVPIMGLNRRLTVREIDALMAELLEGVQRCHDAGWVHGHLQTNSVWAVQHLEGSFSLALMDGWRFCPRAELKTFGTLDHLPTLMAPELCWSYSAMEEDPQMNELITEKADVYSLGLLYHILLTGKLPSFQEEGCLIPAQQETLHLSPRLAKKRQALIKRMLSLDPQERPSCGEAAESMKKG